MRPPRSKFEEELCEQYIRKAVPPYLLFPFVAHLIDVFGDVYDAEFPGSLPEHLSSAALKRYELKLNPDAYTAFFKVCLTALLSCTKAAPPIATQRTLEMEHALYASPLYNDFVGCDEKKFTSKNSHDAYWLKLGVYQMYAALAEPFKNGSPVYLFGLFDPDDDGAPYVPERPEYDPYERNADSRYEKRKKEWEKTAEEFRNLVSSWEWPFLHTALWKYANKFLPSSEVMRSFPIDLATRFSHQWVMAPPRLGKTTLLSHQINYDLDMVVRGEGSIFVMDSQNSQLTKFLPKLKRFAPGGDLEGKLVYLEPDERYPLALNIFDFQSADYREAEQLTLAFMAPFVETSEYMKNIIKYALRAMIKIPDATIHTFKELLDYRKVKGGIIPGFTGLAERYPVLLRLDADTVQFLSKRVFEGGYVASISALKARLDSFTADPLFNAMFSHPRSRLNLADELAQGKVVIVNANDQKLQEAKEPFGRYFLSRLLQTSRARLGEETTKLPVLAYIDEAQDYIAHDASIKNLLFQARKQNVGMCIAHHDTSQIDADVAAALGIAAIKCAPIKQGLFNFEIAETSGTKVYPLSVPLVEFNKMPLMNEREWENIQYEMRKTYAIPANPLPWPAREPTLTPLRPAKIGFLFTPEDDIASPSDDY